MLSIKKIELFINIGKIFNIFESFCHTQKVFFERKKNCQRRLLMTGIEIHLIAPQCRQWTDQDLSFSYEFPYNFDD